MVAPASAAPARAAANIRHVVSLSGDNGTYYDERQPASPNPQAADHTTQNRLHEITTRMLRGLLPF